MAKKLNKGNKGKELDPLEEEVSKRADWEHHNEQIYASFIKLANEKKRYPKIREIASETGLSSTTVFKHMRDPDFDSIKKKYSIFSEAALFTLATKAVQGKSKDWTELYFKIVEGIGDKKQLDLTSGGKRIGGDLDLSLLTDEELIAYKSIKNKMNG